MDQGLKARSIVQDVASPKPLERAFSPQGVENNRVLGHRPQAGMGRTFGASTQPVRNALRAEERTRPTV